MIPDKSYNHLFNPGKFILVLLGLWVFFTLTLGLYSEWIFESILPQAKDYSGDGFLFACIYSGCFLGIFGFSWGPLNRLFPLDKIRNLLFHAIAQVTGGIFAFGLGFILTNYMHSLLYPDAELDGANALLSLSVIALLCLIGILMVNGVFYASSYLFRSQESENRRIESELSALRAQINPHFLFNSLNSIAALIRISPDKAERVTEDLADLFRYTLHASESPMVSLKEEIEMTKRYLSIEEARFGDRLNIQYEFSDHCMNQNIPVLTLQPLAENAVKHGVSKAEHEHTITLGCQMHDNSMEIFCKDTGPGFGRLTFEQAISSGTGLNNVYRRLKLSFGDEIDARLDRNTIVFRIPLQEIADDIL